MFVVHVTILDCRHYVPRETAAHRFKRGRLTKSNYARNAAAVDFSCVLDGAMQSFTLSSKKGNPRRTSAEREGEHVFLVSDGETRVALIPQGENRGASLNPCPFCQAGELKGE